MKLMSGFDSNYRYILVAARRARQLQTGAPALIKTGSRKVCRIAQDELNAGLIGYSIEKKIAKPLVAPVEIFDGGKH